MRRPRSRLHVSTFPFLAVLLCAMGSLLLLLFIMDRRAKIAAQHQVEETKAVRAARSKAEEDERLAQWEAARRKLEQALLAQHGDLAIQMKGVRSDADDANKRLQFIHAQHADLIKQLKGEAANISLLELQLVNQRGNLKEAAKKEQASKSELADAVKELAELELAFHALKELRKRGKDTYSVVPYRGKHGDSRTPIYVECQAEGVLFHPDQKLLGGIDFNALSLRSEIERCSGPLVTAKTSRDKKVGEAKAQPYILFLVRPDGIATYYKAQAALNGFALDFGYELVDQDWVLDFDGAPATKPAPTQMAKTNPLAKPVPPPIGVDSANPLLTPKQGGGGNSQPPWPPVGIGNPNPFLPPKQGGAPPNQGGGGNLPPPVGLRPPRVDTGIPGKLPSFVPVDKIAPPVPIASTGNAGAVKPPSGVADPPAGDRGPKLPPAVVSDPRPAPPVGRVIGNKDFVITIDCYADHVNVFPGGQMFRWKSADTKATDQAFVQAITSLIARRQASVREGEPPYRPVIRFQVSADGLRGYYHVYPLLEHLRIPMTRENVED